jgi:3-mercaptopyruvate sulfurtransferase SseA
MKLIMTSLVGATLALSIVTACQSSAAPTNISKVEQAPAVQPQKAAAETTHVDEDAPRISLEEAKKDFDAGTAIFVDTRDASAYNADHIKGAINIPVSELQTKINTIPTDKKIIAYCS